MAATLRGTPNAAAAASVTIPTHAVGDTIVIYAYRDGSTTVPSKPAASGTVPAWVDIDAPAGANTNSARTAYFVATATNHTSGTWTNATGMVAVVIQGAKSSSPIGGHAQSGSTGNGSAVSPSITQSVTDGSSLLLYFYGHRTVTAWSAAPAGYTRQASVATEVCLNTKDSSTSDGSATQSATTSNSGYRSAVVEVLAVVPLALGLGKVANTPSASTPPVPQSPVLDDFNRADNTSSLGANWTGSVLPAGWPSHGILSNQLYPASAFKSSYWNTLLGADQEVYATLSVIATSGGNPWTELFVRVQNPNSGSLSYYAIRVNSGSSFLVKSVAGSQSTIGGTYGVGQDGDVWGLQARGEKVYVWRKRAGSWSLLDTVTDSSVVGPGYIGLASGDDATIRVDDFGGGTIDTVWGATLAASGAAPLGTGKVPTAAALYGLGLTPGAVALALGLVSSAQALHGIDLATGAAALELDLGHITTAQALHGLGLTPGVVALAVGKIAADELVRGLGLSASGAAPLGAGKVASAESIHGPAIAGSGAVELGLFKIPGPRPVELLDDFNRADADDLGPDWTAVGGFSPELISNAVELNSGLLLGSQYKELLPADSETSWTLLQRTDDGFEFQAWLRGDPDANFAIACRVEFGPTGSGDDTVQIMDVWTQTVYGESTTESIANGDVLTFRLIGTTGYVYQNGNLILTASDSGMRNEPGWTYVWGNGTPTRLDDFTAGSVAGVHGPGLTASGAAPLATGKVATSELLHGPTILGSGAVPLLLGAVASTEALYGLDLSSAGILLLGKIPTAELLHGPTLDPGSVALGLGRIASAETLHGLELSSGGVVLLLGRIASGEGLHGLDLIGSGLAALGLGRIGSTAAVRGPAILGSGPVALGLGHAASEELVRGLALTPHAAALMLGHVATAATLHGLDLDPFGAAALPVGKILTASLLHGPDVAASGAVALGLGAIPSSSVVRGVRLVVQSGVASAVLVLESPAVAIAGDGPQIVVALTTPEITAALRAAGVELDPDAPYIVLTLENL